MRRIDDACAIVPNRVGAAAERPETSRHNQDQHDDNGPGSYVRFPEKTAGVSRFAPAVEICCHVFPFPRRPLAGRLFEINWTVTVGWPRLAQARESEDAQRVSPSEDRDPHPQR
jgi:hypothetical protein